MLFRDFVCICSELIQERRQLRDQLVHFKQQHDEVEIAAQTTIDDLTRGIVSYKCLGLDFEKAGNEGLRCVSFVLAVRNEVLVSCILHLTCSKFLPLSWPTRLSFTQLDANAPNKKYSFELITTPDDHRFTVVELDPPGAVERAPLEELLETLNKTNDMMAFIRDMRKAFLEYICN